MTATTRTFLTLGPAGLALESEPTTEAEWRERFEGVRWLRNDFAFSSSDIHFLLEECGLRGEIKRIAPGHTRIYVPAGSALFCLSLQGWLAEQMPADALIDVVQEVAPMGETMPPASFAGVPFPYGGRVTVGRRRSVGIPADSFYGCPVCGQTLDLRDGYDPSGDHVQCQCGATIPGGMLRNAEGLRAG